MEKENEFQRREDESTQKDPAEKAKHGNERDNVSGGDNKEADLDLTDEN